MTDFLLLTFYAPLASWGDVAVGEIRGSWDRPSRSAVLGVLAASLGIDRSDQERHDALDRGYGVAVRLDAIGSMLIDYHTVQTAPESAVRTAKGGPRRALLAAGEPGTLLSRRSYRQDSAAVIAIWARNAVSWSLEDLAGAVRCPAYTLYAGRKANPFGLPLAPEIVSAVSLAAALNHRSFVPSFLGGTLRWPGGARTVQVAHDPCDGFPSGLVPYQSVIRRDAQAHRSRWQFAERTVEIGHLEGGQTP